MTGDAFRMCPRPMCPRTKSLGYFRPFDNASLERWDPWTTRPLDVASLTDVSWRIVPATHYPRYALSKVPDGTFRDIVPSLNKKRSPETHSYTDRYCTYIRSSRLFLYGCSHQLISSERPQLKVVHYRLKPSYTHMKGPTNPIKYRVCTVHWFDLRIKYVTNRMISQCQY